MEREIKTLSRRNLARSEFDGENTYRHAYRVERLEPGNAVVIDVNMRIVGRDIEMLHSLVTGLQFAIKLNTLGLACGGSAFQSATQSRTSSRRGAWGSRETVQSSYGRCFR